MVVTIEGGDERGTTAEWSGERGVSQGSPLQEWENESWSDYGLKPSQNHRSVEAWQTIECWAIEPSNHQTVELLSCRTVKLLNCRAADASNRQTVNPFSRRTVEPIKCSTVELLNRQIVKPSHRWTVEPSNHRTVEVSDCGTFELSNWPKSILGSSLQKMVTLIWALVPQRKNVSRPHGMVRKTHAARHWGALQTWENIAVDYGGAGKQIP